MACRVAASPNGITSTGSGKRPSTGTNLLASAITIIREDAAATIFTYVASLGKDRPLYVNARTGVLEARSKKILQAGLYTAADLKSLIYNRP